MFHVADDPRAFLERVGPWLEEREAENNLLLGLAATFAEHPVPGASFLWLDGGDGPAGAALTTAARGLVLSRFPGAELAGLAATLAERGLPAPAANGPVETSDAFARAWSERTGATASVFMEMRLHRLDRVERPPATPGRLRPAVARDRELAYRWLHAFAVEAGVFGADPKKPPDESPTFDQGRLSFWEVDGQPVSMAARSRPTRRGTCISGVYTPPELRGRGYASSVVAALSQRLLDGGRDFCVLFTDLANPTSNKIYANVGYRPLADFRHYRFD